MSSLYAQQSCSTVSWRTRAASSRTADVPSAGHNLGMGDRAHSGEPLRPRERVWVCWEEEVPGASWRETQQYEKIRWTSERQHGGPKASCGPEPPPVLPSPPRLLSWTRSLSFSKAISSPSLPSSLLRMESQISQTFSSPKRKQFVILISLLGHNHKVPEGSTTNSLTQIFSCLKNIPPKLCIVKLISKHLGIIPLSRVLATLCVTGFLIFSSFFLSPLLIVDQEKKKRRGHSWEKEGVTRGRGCIRG